MNNEMLHLCDIRAEEAAALLRGKVIYSIIPLLKVDICDESNERLQSLVKSKKRNNDGECGRLYFESER